MSTRSSLVLCIPLAINAAGASASAEEQAAHPAADVDEGIAERVAHACHDSLAAHNSRNSPQRDEARAHAQRGQERLDAGDDLDALTEFKAAYSLARAPFLLLNEAVAYSNLQRRQEAITTLWEFAATQRMQASTQCQSSVEGWLRDLGARIAYIRLSCERPGIHVAVDGLSAPMSGVGVLVDEGRHTVAFAGPDYAPPIASVDIFDGQVERVECPVEERPAKADPTWNTIGWIVTGVGVLLGGGAAVHYAWNKSRYDNWHATTAQLESQRGSADWKARAGANNALASSIESASGVTVGLTVSSGVILTSGVAILAIDRAASPDINDRHPIGLAWRGTW